jgi:predicted anti-sigma-YlaC factor YlaD
MTPPSRFVCHRIRNEVSLELDDELSQLERAILESHLRRCAACRSFRDDLLSFTQEIREAPLQEYSGLPLAVPRRKRVHADALTVASVAATIAVALGLGLTVGGLGAGNSRATQSVRPAYLDSPGYDLSIIKHVRDARDARRIIRAV